MRETSTMTTERDTGTPAAGAPTAEAQVNFIEEIIKADLASGKRRAASTRRWASAGLCVPASASAATR